MRNMVFTLALVACAGAKAQQRGVVEIKSLKDSNVRGELVFTETGSGYRVEGVITGLPANSSHGFHIHEAGDCSAADGSSAEGHFNPEHVEHGARMDVDSHVGDLGNIQSDAAGVARISVTKKKGRLHQGAEAIAGRAVIVHAGADDLKSQPSGDAGGRIGCGVIGVGK
jgi:Cu-Zn family superoxide dismutase